MNRSNKKRARTDSHVYCSDSGSDTDYMDDDEREIRNIKLRNPQGYAQLRAARARQRSMKPSLTLILEQPLSIDDTCKLLRLLGVYQSCLENSKEFHDAYTEFHNELKRSHAEACIRASYSRAERERIEDLDRELSAECSKDVLKYQILSLKTTRENVKAILRNYVRFSALEMADDEFNKLKLWLDWAMRLPYSIPAAFEPRRLGVRRSLAEISQKLDAALFGMEKVKERILVFANAKLTNPNVSRCSLGLIGPPGVGKTAIAKVLADALQFPFAQINFGGAKDSAFLMGHDYTYIGSQPGEIIKALCRMGSSRGILFMDEFDKISEAPGLAATLLHITDPIQSSEFRDSYLAGVSVDLSRLWLMYSMNLKPTDKALSDRIFYAHVGGYSRADKYTMVSNFLLPKACKNASLQDGAITFSSGAINLILDKYIVQDSPGVRELEAIINDIVAKVSFLHGNQSRNGTVPGIRISFNLDEKVTLPIVVNESSIAKLLGAIPKIPDSEIHSE